MKWSEVWAKAYLASIAVGIGREGRKIVADNTLKDYKEREKAGAFEQ